LKTPVSKTLVARATIAEAIVTQAIIPQGIIEFALEGNVSSKQSVDRAARRTLFAIDPIGKD
jgi:hypothetical protein